MEVEVVPLTDFVHGRRSFQQDVPLELSEAEANDLERAGLVRVKMAPQVKNKMAPVHQGKAPADGEATPSASSPAAPASRSKTVDPLPPGGGKSRKQDT